jgi:hypothetical protein
MNAVAWTLPFDMPVRILRARLELLEVPWKNPPERALLTRRLWGALQTSLLHLGCTQDCMSEPAFEHGGLCRRGAACPVFWLYKPRSAEQKRHHASPLALRAAATSDNVLVARIACFGRHALGFLPLIQHALAASGQLGLEWESVKFPFRCRMENSVAGLLGELTAAPTPLEELSLEFTTPCQVTMLDLASVAANAAHDMSQWALCDSGQAVRLSKKGCDAESDAVGTRAAQAVGALHTIQSATSFRTLGTRRSHSNAGSIRMDGFTARMGLSGPLREAFPWLALLALRGGGRHKSLGMGEIKLDAHGVADHLRVY